jgi:hypothetical protein
VQAAGALESAMPELSVQHASLKPSSANGHPIGIKEFKFTKELAAVLAIRNKQREEEIGEKNI